MKPKIIDGSHLDHGLSPAQLTWLLDHDCPEGTVSVWTLELPEELGTIACDLHGPCMGEPPILEPDVYYSVRGGRRCASRLTSLPPGQTRKVTLITGPEGAEPCVLYTCYGGTPAPREPGDPSINSWEELLASREFWKTHALSGHESKE